MTPTPAGRRGAFARAWIRLFGERDPVQAQLDALEKEGQRLASLAHTAAFVMLILFSAGSLVALAGDSVQAIINGHASIPAAIAVGVSALLVLCMDTAMIYGASLLRLLAIRRQNAGGGVHKFVLITVAVIEAATYAYMSWKYERPDGIAWFLIGARALMAPLLSVYLSLARALPVTGRDILAMIEKIAAENVLQDVAMLTADRSASLADKLALYEPVAVNAPEDQARLNRLFAAAQQRVALPAPEMALDASEEGNRPPTGPGSPITAPTVQTLPDEPPNVRRLPSPRARRRPAAQRRATMAAREVRTGKRSFDSYESEARAAWAEGAHTLGPMMSKTGMSRATASKWLTALKAEGSNVPIVAPVEDAGQLAQ